MQASKLDFPPTIVIRHKKENLKKCSLRGLENRADFLFYRYPLLEIPPYEQSILLTLDASVELTEADYSCSLLIVDATWRYAQEIIKRLPGVEKLKKRRLPAHFKTAYPRRQNDCSDPSCGLASLEAIFCAYTIMGRSCANLLDAYYWKDSFLEKNKTFLLKWNEKL
jgi:pre-rRNA-processing protein TSR3